tara:strand:- start:1419 stop:1913 length:495 start_codon:yes stop_codon:yes gene_type:complete
MSSLTKADWDSKLPIYKISPKKLHNQGIRFLLLDVDGTLLNRNTNRIPSKVKSWIKKSKTFFKLYLVSNNPSEKRISSIGNQLGVSYKFKALKPSKKITLEIINIMNETTKNTAIIGDRIFTDIIVGNRCNIKTILVSRLNRDGLPIKVNFTLIIERILSALFL